MKPPKLEIFTWLYTVHDKEGVDYVLGMRQMISKSAENTLDTLKIILDDLSAICSELSEGGEENDVGLKILTNIKNTMSDRAATEGLFNNMLQTFREKCLPMFKEGWEHFTPAAKAKLTEMNNFFCGLHLLVSMAETIATSFKTYEDMQTEQNVGALSVPGVSVLNKSEAGTTRLVRTACKAFAKGGDEKSGCHRAWKTFLRGNNITKTYLQCFHGNRFNIIFLLGGCLYHLRNYITEFLSKVHGTPNNLLRAVHADMGVPVFIVGCRVLGLLNKLITAPLWRITEKEGHILDMCETYNTLHTFLGECINDDNKLQEFIQGNLSCFPEHDISKDEVFASLTEVTEFDVDTQDMLKAYIYCSSSAAGKSNKRLFTRGEIL